jgi:hypothetical protein
MHIVVLTSRSVTLLIVTTCRIKSDAAACRLLLRAATHTPCCRGGCHDGHQSVSSSDDMLDACVQHCCRLRAALLLLTKTDCCVHALLAAAAYAAASAVL